VFGSRDDCFRCGAPRPGGSAPASRMLPGDWTCGGCGASPVFARHTECFRCGAPRPEEDDGRTVGGRERPAEPEFRAQFERTRVFVENLPPDVDWQRLKDHFLDENYPVVYASVSTDASGRSKGHGIVQFETVHAAQHAIDYMTGSTLDGADLNVRPDYQEARRRQPGAAGAEGERRSGGEGHRDGADDRLAGGRGGGTKRDRAAAPPREPWMSREWRRVEGSLDGEAEMDVDEVLTLLAARDDARERRDYAEADELLHELGNLGVSVDDARRQRTWWVGRRVDDDAFDTFDGRGRGDRRGGGAGGPRGRSRDGFRESRGPNRGRRDSW